MRRVLVCGGRAFAAEGLAGMLRQRGFEVELFTRGSLGRPLEDCICGPVLDLHENPHLAARYDAVVNFIVLKGESVARNVAYIESLLQLCRERSVEQLIQISSMSVYRDTLPILTERSPTAAVQHSGAYAAAKLAAEHYLAEHARSLKVSLVRPAGIIGSHMPDPVGSIGAKLPGGELLVLAPPQRRRPIIGRSVLHRAVARLIEDPAPVDREVLLAVDRDSPTCLTYLQGLCDVLGLGTGVVTRSMPSWIAAYVRRKWSIDRSPSRLLSDLRQRCLCQQFDPAWTENRLGFALTSNWRKELICHQPNRDAALVSE